MTILVVDDSRAMRMIVRRTLRQAGFGHHTVVEAADGAEALEEVQKARPDLVLSDWNMPVMNGLEFLKRLRAAGLRVPFGFVTTERTSEMKRTAAEAGANFMISKPFTAEHFKQALTSRLG